jgi:hypothetical protein
MLWCQEFLTHLLMESLLLAIVTGTWRVGINATVGVHREAE